MAAAIVFDYAVWVAMFPEFASVSQPMAQGYFNRACNLFQNNTCNPAFGAGNMSSLFDLLTAHIVWLNAPRDGAGNPASTGQPASPLVGRMASAAEGSVSVGVEWSGTGSPSEAWFTQTKYGAEFWQATAQYRTARYMARPTVVVDGVFPYLPRALR